MTDSTRTRRFFERMLDRPGLALALVLAFTAAAGTLAAIRVRPDFSVEMMFPERDYSKRDYDRFRRDFRFEDAHPLVVIEAPDLFTPDGIRRVAALEKDLANVLGVIDTDGLGTIKDLVNKRLPTGELAMSMERLFPSPDLSPEAFAAKRRTATQDPLFRWVLTHPSGDSTTIRVTMNADYAAKDDTRMQFLHDAREVIAKHERAGQKIVMSGMPVVRAEFTELIMSDMMTLVPIATLIITLILLLSFRSLGLTIAAMLTLGASNIWALGGFGVLGYPVQLLSQMTPIVVMIISVSDTVHVIRHFKHMRAEGHDPRSAIVEAMVDSCWPCFLTELVIALGFLALVGQDVIMISQFGLVTSLGMMLTWAANMTVLPLALYYGQAGLAPIPAGSSAAAAPRPEAESAPMLALARLLRWIDHITQRHPRRVVVVAIAITTTMLVLGRGIGKEYRAYDDLYPDHRIQKNLDFLEAKHGGSLPFAVLIEPRVRNVLVVGADEALLAQIRRVYDATELAFSIEAADTIDAIEAANASALAAPEGGSSPDPPDLVLVAAPGAEAEAILTALANSPRTAEAPLVLLLTGAVTKGEPEAVEAALFEAGVFGVVGVFDPAADGAEARLGGTLRHGEPMLTPEVMRLMDRIALYCETSYPDELKNATAVSDFLKKSHALWLEDEPQRGEVFPPTRGAVVQELEFIDKRLLRDFLSADRATAAVYGQMQDCGSSRGSEILQDLRAYLVTEEAATGYKLTATGLFAVADATFRNMVGGLALSLGGAILISLITFILVLRSWRLGLIALIPNVLPLALTLGFMALLGIDLKPTTVICFSITLVIADDDTIQFLVRYRRRFLELVRAGVANPHDRAASDTLDDTGVPMFLTACTVSLGFFSLVFSEFLALKTLGLLIGVSLFSAVFADLFLSPVMLRTFKPTIDGYTGEPGDAPRDGAIEDDA